VWLRTIHWQVIVENLHLVPKVRQEQKNDGFIVPKVKTAQTDENAQIALMLCA